MGTINDKHLNSGTFDQPKNNIYASNTRNPNLHTSPGDNIFFEGTPPSKQIAFS
jgi:hypothetical protein